MCVTQSYLGAIQLKNGQFKGAVKTDQTHLSGGQQKGKAVKWQMMKEEGAKASLPFQCS